MKILVINLAGSTDRRIFQQEQLKQLGLDFEILPAVSVNDIEDSTYQSMSQGWERSLRRSELACYLSHQQSWETVLKDNQPTLILEDDALLSRHVPTLLSTLVNCRFCDLVTLEVRGRKKIVAKQGETLTKDHQLFKLYQDRTGAAGYVLWPSGAKKLLNKARTVAPALADAFISSAYELNAYQVEPAAIIQLDQCKHYNITNSTQTKSAISSEVKPVSIANQSSGAFAFKVRRISSQLRMGWRQLSTLHQSTKRSIELIAEDFPS
ncbi:MAG: Beta-1,4-galactosyltransferase [uncultured Thiotrichaceae bacterium]|uniref:Beta-1,4-galactosyltransferase n=1 Tax=uncultured Thiotrichaceae bacterium TaxID=298394 RepID=A0A6S6TIW9_9GAMM|nr:MAG: Beta-1,4-galactosyltransferase [uncultured Thiotrichaceae bacterium]